MTSNRLKLALSAVAGGISSTIVYTLTTPPKKRKLRDLIVNGAAGSLGPVGITYLVEKISERHEGL